MLDSRASGPLLGAGEPGSVTIHRPDGASEIILVCEHASHRVPEALGNLGLSSAELESHIGWDIGALAVAERISEILDATLIAQNYSRLAYDCNRPPSSSAAMPEQSEIYSIPGNAALTPQDRRARTEALYIPFQQAIAAQLDSRIAMGRSPVLVTLHSFTPVYFGVPRNVDIGILHDDDHRLADHLLAAFAVGRHNEYRVDRNKPYGPEDGVTHTLRLQAISRGLLNVMIEIGNQLISDEAGQEKLAELFGRKLGRALDALTPASKSAGGNIA